MKLRKKNKRRIFTKFPITKIVPNLATLSAFFTGLLQVRFAMHQQWEYALLAVIGAAIFDAMDGRLARMLNVCSHFGAELDSLSDLVVFGVCPALVLYMFSLHEFDRAGWVVCAFFAICMALRLARFNVPVTDSSSIILAKYGFSVGVPAPAGAILNLIPLAMYNAFNIKPGAWICLIISIISSMLCISRIQTFTIKKLHIKKDDYTAFLLGILVCASIIYVYTWRAFFVIVLLYICSIPVSYSKAKKILKLEQKDE